MARVRAVFLLLGLALLLFTATAGADGPVSCSFSGTVKLDGAETAGGTLITAVIEDDEYNTHTPAGDASSRYFITIRPPEGKTYTDGTKVVFKVNGHTTDQTATFQAGASTTLDLTASSKAATVPLSTWLTALLILLLAVALGMACYLLFRTMSKRRKLTKTVTAVKPVTAIKEDKVVAEPRRPYVWDKTKLAWVQAAKPDNGGSQQTIPTKSKPVVQQPAVSPLVAKKPAVKRRRVARFPRKDDSIGAIDI